MDHQIVDIQFRPYDPATQTEPRTDIIGWASCIFNGLYLNNMMVKRLPSGRAIIAYPRHTRGGNQRTHFYFNPINRETQEALDRAILDHIEEVHRNGTKT